MNRSMVHLCRTSCHGGLVCSAFGVGAAVDIDAHGLAVVVKPWRGLGGNGTEIVEELMVTLDGLARSRERWRSCGKGARSEDQSSSP